MFWNEGKQKEAEKDRKREERINEFKNLPKYKITSAYNLNDNDYDYSIEVKNSHWSYRSDYTFSFYDKIYTNKSKDECEIRMKKLNEIEKEGEK